MSHTPHEPYSTHTIKKLYIPKTIVFVLSTLLDWYNGYEGNRVQNY